MSSESIPSPIMGMTVAICDGSNGYAYKGKNPWPYIKQDHEFFMNKVTTTKDPAKKNGILKGRRTWETDSLADRQNPKVSVFITSTTLEEVPLHAKAVVPNYNDGIDEILKCVKSGELENVWVLGGSKNYELAINDPRFTVLYITRILQDFPTDSYFPDFTHLFEKTSTSEVYTDPDCQVPYQFETWNRKLE